MLNDDNDSEDIADVNLGSNPDAITRRLNRVVHKLTVANTRLAAIKAAYPPGPPSTPQTTALSAIVTQAAQLTDIANSILAQGPVIGPQ